VLEYPHRNGHVAPPFGPEVPPEAAPRPGAAARHRAVRAAPQKGSDGLQRLCRALYAFLIPNCQLRTKAVRAHLEGCDDCDDNFVFEARFLDQLGVAALRRRPAELRQRVILKLRARHLRAVTN